jgi:hypothetical protein
VSLGSREPYRPIIEVLDDTTARQRLLDNARRDLRAFRTKYTALSELSQVFAAIAAVLQE